MEANYLIIKETYTYCTCSTCKGAGKTIRTFQGHKFTRNCTPCDGSGREKITRRTEIPLAEALKEINANQKL